MENVEQNREDLKALDRLAVKFASGLLETVLKKGETEITAEVTVTVKAKLSAPVQPQS